VPGVGKHVAVNTFRLVANRNNAANNTKYDCKQQQQKKNIKQNPLTHNFLLC